MKLKEALVRNIFMPTGYFLKCCLMFSLTGIFMLMSVHAQVSTGVTGTVIEQASGKPIPFCTVRLLGSRDNKLITAVQTNEKGSFFISVARSGNYIVHLSFVGFIPYQSLAFRFPEVSSLDTIRMQEDSRTLKGVTVTGKQDLIVKGPDKLVLNVENSLLATNGTANELLQQVPGLWSGDNGQIKLNGKSGVTILIDGKISPLSGSELGMFLQNMPSGSITRIEVMDNPSSRYDATGAGGIINIITKKPSRAGINGSATLGYNYGPGSNYIGSLMLNAKKGRVNLFGSYSYNRLTKAADYYIDRTIAGDEPLFFHQIMKFRPYFNNHLAKAAIDYEVNSRSTAGFTFDWSSFQRDRTISDITYIGKPAQMPDSVYDTRTRNIKRLDNYSYNFYYNYRFDSTGHQLAINYTLSQFSNADDRFSHNDYTHGDGTVLKPSNSLRNQVPFKVNNNVVRVDYMLPLNKHQRMEIGAKAAWIDQRNNLIYDSLYNGKYVNIPGMGSTFTYHEKVLAAYADYTWNKGPYRVTAGLRAEKTISESNFITAKQVVSFNYLDLFPKVSLGWKAGKHALAASAGRRIGRPSYQDLDPTLIYFNQYYYLQGNPQVTPQYTQTYILSDTYRDKYSVTLNYTRTRNPLASVQTIQEGTNVNILTVANLDVLNNVSLSVDIPVIVNRWWDTYNNIYGYTDHTHADNYMGKSYDRSLSGYGFSTRHTFSVSDNCKLETQFRYDSPQLFGLNKLDEVYSLTMGVQHSFLNKKAVVKVSVYDVLNSMKFVYHYDYANVNASESRVVYYRQLRCSFTYNFGRNQVKNRKNSENDNGNERMKVL